MVLRLATGLMLLSRGISQGFILVPILFDIVIDDVFLFIEKSNVCSFANDNIFFSCGDNLSEILESLVHDMKILLRWVIYG